MDDLKKYAELCKAQQRSIDNYARVINALKDDFDRLQGAVLAEREACAKSCEEWGIKKVNDWAHDEEMCEDAKARAWDAMQCAAEIRARGEI